LRLHPAYEQLIEKATRSHEKNRSPEGVGSANVGRARLYSYAFRLHTIGTFHATRIALHERPAAGPLATAYRTRAVETLEDLVNQAMEPVPRDFRVVISTLHRYHRNVCRVLDSLRRDYEGSRDAEIARITERFHHIVEQITVGNGIHLTQDQDAPAQASFVVPNLGIIIVPLVYGDYHSWNLAYLAGQFRNVPTHRHHQGVEIHLGFNPTHGMTVLGKHRAPVDEGYAMPIPPETDHGWVNTSAEIHHVPFIFGSLRHGGWGVFLDVEAQPKPVDELTAQVPRDSTPFRQMVYLERQVARAEAMASSWQTTLIPHTVTLRGGSGGLELNLTRINPAGYSFPLDEYRIVSVVRGEGVIRIEDIEQPVKAHDHFGVPAGMNATIKQTGTAPLVALDALIRGMTSSPERQRRVSVAGAADW
jgi:hypothetical protein